MASNLASSPARVGAPPAPAGEAESRARLDSLTGLRFFAAFAVFSLHLAVIYSGGSMALLNLRHYYAQGMVGVSFFFILSGFVLTWSHQPLDRAASFMRRRLARIGPLHIVTTAVAVLIVVVVHTWPGRHQALISFFLLPAWDPYWSSHKVLDAPSWSLGCELFFYALFPLLYAGLRRCPVAIRRVIAVACAATPLVLALALDPTTTYGNAYWLIYYFPPVRLVEFVLGMILAMEVAEGRIPRIPLLPVIVVNIAVYIVDGWQSLALSPVAVTVAPFAVLIVAAAQSDVARRFSLLRSRAVVTLGVWSFAFYLAHYPVMTAIAYIVKGQLDPTAMAMVAAACFTGTLVAAALLHTKVERPLELLLRGSRLPAVLVQPRMAVADGQGG